MLQRYYFFLRSETKRGKNCVRREGTVTCGKMYMPALNGCLFVGALRLVMFVEDFVVNEVGAFETK